MSQATAPTREPTAEAPAPPFGFASATEGDRDRLRSATRPSVLEASIASLRGAGPKLAAAAAEIGIETIGDLLLWVPHSYRERSAPRKLAELRIGEQATVADESGPAKAVWFNQAWLVERLSEGTRLLLYGKLDRSGLRVEAHEFL